MALIGILNGIFLTTVHILIGVTMGSIAASNNGMNTTVGGLIILIVLYVMSLYYKDCILTTWEAKLMPFVAVDLIGFHIPKYDFSNTSRSLIGQTTIVIGIITLSLKIIRYFTIDLYYNYEDNKKKRKRKSKREKSKKRRKYVKYIKDKKRGKMRFKW